MAQHHLPLLPGQQARFKVTFESSRVNRLDIIDLENRAVLHSFVSTDGGGVWESAPNETGFPQVFLLHATHIADGDTRESRKMVLIGDRPYEYAVIGFDDADEDDIRDEGDRDFNDALVSVTYA